MATTCNLLPILGLLVSLPTAMTKVVCVTGASGYIASCLVQLLLRRGYTVKATVRSLRDPSKVQHLKALEGAEERLELFEADLVEEGSFDSVIDGCDGVFHTASPVVLDEYRINDPQMELIEPAVKGTLNVLSSCAKTPSVKRVVLTSSMASVLFKRNAIMSSGVVDETWFSDPQFAQEAKQWYALSKILAEEAAVKFSQEKGIDLVVTNPGLVIGPLLQPTINDSIKCFIDLITQGKSDEGMGNGTWVFVDVRDVAYAHVAAFEDPSANGRYCVVANVLRCSEALNILRRLYPAVTFPNSPEENQTATEPPFQVSIDKAKSLGVTFISAEQSMKHTIQSLREKNLIRFTI